MSSKRLQQESFRKRRNNFIRRGHEISTRYNVDVSICIRRNGQYYVYNSRPSDGHWPPSSKQLVTLRYHNLLSLDLIKLQETLYPVPIIKSAKDFMPNMSKAKRAKDSTESTGRVPLLKQLPRPPVPEYAYEDIFSGKMLEMYRDN